MCSLCYKPIKIYTSSEIAIFNCGHMYHTECESSKNCRMCMSNIDF